VIITSATMNAIKFS